MTFRWLCGELSRLVVSCLWNQVVPISNTWIVFTDWPGGAVAQPLLWPIHPPQPGVPWSFGPKQSLLLPGQPWCAWGRTFDRCPITRRQDFQQRMTKSQPATWGVIVLFSGFYFLFFLFESGCSTQRLRNRNPTPSRWTWCWHSLLEKKDVIYLHSNDPKGIKKCICCCVAPWTEQNPSVFNWSSVVSELFHCSASVYSCGLPGSGVSINSASNLSPPLFSEY